LCIIFHSSLILHQKAGSFEPAFCNLRKKLGRLSQWLIETAPLIICDIRGILNLENKHIVLIGISLGLVILPFANKLKAFGLEFERLTEKK
jgi:hypothetical protein